MSDDHIGVKVNGVLYVKLEDARKLREGWDKADERIAELEAALRPLSEMFLYPDDLGFETAEDIKSDPDWCSDANDLRHEDLFVLRRDIRKARAALEGGKDE